MTILLPSFATKYNSSKPSAYDGISNLLDVAAMAFTGTQAVPVRSALRSMQG
jgi:hypothetical protein